MILNQGMRQKTINIISHAAGWLLFFSLVIGFLSNQRESAESIAAKLFEPAFIVFYLVYLSLFYINYFFLIPQIYLKKNYVIYFAVIFFLFVAVYFIKPFDGLMRMNPPPNQPPGIERADSGMPPPKPRGGGQQGLDITSIILFVTVWSLSTAIQIIRQWRYTERRALQAETDKANAELSFLKSQVNPHFLFNTLNNIYSMAVTKNENTAPSIMKLSNIMRYVTDEVGEHYVPLDSEVDCMKDYIDLQRLRLGSKMNIDFAVKGNTSDKRIAPLLLMTFVENVFKYGISSHEPSDIIIKLSADEHNITFFCQNKLFETKRNAERTGIGIPNARQRLQHLYPDKHFLDISKEKGLFTVQLTLQA
jgi:two-component system, LytTR family, sensor kinase